MANFINGITNYSEWRDHSRDYKTTLARHNAITACIDHANDLSIAEQIGLMNSIAVSTLTGKLQDYFSISTSVLMNERCQMRAKIKGCICAECYAADGVARWQGLTQATETNFEILNGFLIDESVWACLPLKTTNGDFRIESHGDVASVTCARNYIRIIRTHKHLMFGVWTKNIDIWEKAFMLEGKPDNMTFIVSSPFVNVVLEVPENMRQYVNHVFTVYDEEYARLHNITINCGARSCARCRQCYKKETEYFINELKK